MLSILPDAEDPAFHAPGLEARSPSFPPAQSTFSVSSDGAVVAEYALRGSASMDVATGLAELVRVGCESTTIRRWIGPWIRFCAPDAHPVYEPQSGHRLAESPQIFKVPCFTERFHGWAGDDAGEYTSGIVAAISVVARTVNASRVARSLLKAAAEAYPRMEDDHRRGSDACPTLPLDPLSPFVDLCHAVLNVMTPLDMTTLRNDSGDVWAMVVKNMQGVLEWWRLQIRDSAAELEDKTMPYAYVPAVSHLNAWIAEAFRGRLCVNVGPGHVGIAAASWSHVCMLACSLLTETARMLSALGVILSTHVSKIVRAPERNRAKAVWRTCWDATMEFFDRPEHSITPTGLSQFVGMGRIEPNGSTVRMPRLNGSLSKSLGLEFAFVQRLRDVFRLRHDSRTKHSPSATDPGEPVPPWPTRASEDDCFVRPGAETVPTALIEAESAWSYTVFAFNMLCAATADYRLERRPLVYLPPVRFDVIVASRGFVSCPSSFEGSVDFDTAHFEWEQTKIIVRNEDGETGTEEKLFPGGAMQLDAHVVEVIRPLSFGYTAYATKKARRAAKLGDPSAQPRVHGQLRTVVINPCAWGVMAGLI
jgi:hypothetical protein